MVNLFCRHCNHIVEECPNCIGPVFPDDLFCFECDHPVKECPNCSGPVEEVHHMPETAEAEGDDEGEVEEACISEGDDMGEVEEASVCSEDYVGSEDGDLARVLGRAGVMHEVIIIDDSSDGSDADHHVNDGNTSDSTSNSTSNLRPLPVGVCRLSTRI